MSDNCDPHGIERPMPMPSTLTLSGQALDAIDDWRTDAIATAVGIAGPVDVQPIVSLTNCLATLQRMGGVGYAESSSLIVVSTESGLTVGLHRDRKGVCSLNS